MRRHRTSASGYARMACPSRLACLLGAFVVSGIAVDLPLNGFDGEREREVALCQIAALGKHGAMCYDMGHQLDGVRVICVQHHRNGLGQRHLLSSPSASLLCRHAVPPIATIATPSADQACPENP